MTAATLTRPTIRPTARPERTPAPTGYASFGEPVRFQPVAPVPVRRTRLTRRGRAVVLLVGALVLLVAVSLGRTGSQAATATLTGPALQQTTVQQGETLWAVAQRIAPDNDPREVIAQIRRINHLQGSSLRVGQQLLLPNG